MTTTEVIDPDVLQEWLSDAIGQPIERVELELLPQGHANGAWRIVAHTVHHEARAPDGPGAGIDGHDHGHRRTGTTEHIDHPRLATRIEVVHDARIARRLQRQAGRRCAWVTPGW